MLRPSRHQPSANCEVRRKTSPERSSPTACALLRVRALSVEGLPSATKKGAGIIPAPSRESNSPDAVKREGLLLALAKS